MIADLMGECVALAPTRTVPIISEGKCSHRSELCIVQRVGERNLGQKVVPPSWDRFAGASINGKSQYRWGGKFNPRFH